MGRRPDAAVSFVSVCSVIGFRTSRAPAIPGLPGRPSEVSSARSTSPLHPSFAFLARVSQPSPSPPPNKSLKWHQEQPATLVQSSAPVSGLPKPLSEPAEDAECPPPRHNRHNPVTCHGLCVFSLACPHHLILVNHSSVPFVSAMWQDQFRGHFRSNSGFL